MGDPIKNTKKTETVAEQAPPMSAQEAEVRMISENQAVAFKSARTGAPTAVLPFGQRVDATKFVKARYRNQGMSAVLSDPESILTEEWKRNHRGWKYAWPVKGKTDTSAYITSERFTAVPYEAVDKTNHNARVMASPEGHTIWMQHILVAMAPDVHADEYQAPVDDYLARMSMNRRVVEQELNDSFGKHGYRAEYAVTDRRDER